jgi:hypothetical protein
VGLGIVGLFSQLFIGRFFSELPTLLGVALFSALVLLWLPEVPLARRLRPGLRNLARVLLVAVPVALVLLQADRQRKVDSQTPSGSPETTVDDYMGYGR